MQDLEKKLNLEDSVTLANDDVAVNTSDVINEDDDAIYTPIPDDVPASDTTAPRPLPPLPQRKSNYDASFSFLSKKYRNHP